MSRLAITLSLVASLVTVGSVAVAKPMIDAAHAPRREPPAPPDRAQVRKKLVENRAVNLAAFRAYQKEGVFPSNVSSQPEANIWRDEDYHFCAVATIIRTSGRISLVDSVAEQNNGIKMAEVQQGPVMDWILTSGFTQDELALIQRPFRPVTTDASKPTPVIAPTLRTAETARLKKLYKQIDAKLVANQKRSIDAALDRLMQNPTLARRLLQTRA